MYELLLVSKVVTLLLNFIFNETLSSYRLSISILSSTVNVVIWVGENVTGPMLVNSVIGESICSLGSNPKIVTVILN